jgi:HAE1 family hydrophobic/amphiphilic exporter-1
VFVDVTNSFETGRPQLTLDIDRGRAADLGVSVVAVGRTLRTLLAGEKVGSFEDEGRRYDVRVQVLPEYRDDPRKIDLVRVRALGGELVPIRNLADVRVDAGPVAIERSDRARSITISANMAAGASLSHGIEAVRRWSDEIGIRAPDAIEASGQAESMQESVDDIIFAFALAMIAIYMILASLFNSLVLPFAIMTSAPLSFIGGFLALKLAGMSFDMMSGIGLLVLMGLVMKNGILLVDYIITLRARGLARDEAILAAGPVRMRPVLMTSFALIFGMLPMVLSDAVGSAFRAPMAMITIGGLVTSTALTLVVVPVVYSLLDAGIVRLRGAFAQLRGARSTAGDGHAEAGTAH